MEFNDLRDYSGSDGLEAFADFKRLAGIQFTPVMLWSQKSQIGSDAISGIYPFSVGVGVNGMPVLTIVRSLKPLTYPGFCGFNSHSLRSILIMTLIIPLD
jgi:hypothetical protein